MIRLVVLFAVLASPVHALSCVRPDAVRLFEAVRKGPEPYVLIRGRLSVDGPVALPDPDRKEPARTVVRVEGMGLNRQGFAAPVSRDVVLELNCVSVWCAFPPRDGELIMALRVEGDMRVLAVDACGGGVVPWAEDQERRLLECASGGDCKTADGF